MADPRWRQSSYSGAGSNNCVELPHTLDRLRDSKNPAGPTLRADVSALLTTVKEGRFDG
ncbi:MAG: DUF397 domain-containing protein [Candidatus Dormibacteraceae bacterium]